MRIVISEGVQMRTKVRFALFGLLVAAGFALAPAAFARGHLSIGVNLGFPGVSLGYSDCRHCGWGGNYYYGGGYATYYAPSYYAAPVYYGPSYYSYPAYSSVYYSAPVGRVHYSDRYRDRGYRGYRDGGHYYRDGGGHRATYYDRGNYRR